MNPRSRPWTAYGCDSAHVSLQGRKRPLGDLFDGTSSVDAHENALIGVKRDQRRRLSVVDLEPVPDDLFLVIIPLEQLTAAVVADARPRGRLVQHVPHPLAPPTGPSAGQPTHDLFLVDD